MSKFASSPHGPAACGLPRIELHQPRLVRRCARHTTVADCVRELMEKPIKGISLYDIMTRPQPAAFEQTVLSPGDAAEIAMRKDFPKA